MAEVVLDYPHRQAEHCASGALRDLMEWEGLGWAGTGFRGRLAGALAAAQGYHHKRGLYGWFGILLPDVSTDKRINVHILLAPFMYDARN